MPTESCFDHMYLTNMSRLAKPGHLSIKLVALWVWRVSKGAEGSYRIIHRAFRIWLYDNTKYVMNYD